LGARIEERAVAADEDAMARAFARYDETTGGWVWLPGTFAVRVGRSSADLRLSVRVKFLSFR
jgi:hypothetical protein